MACNLGIFNCKGSILQGTETAPGYLFVRLVSPTDFDWAWENMRMRIKSKYGFWKGLDYLGLFAGQLKQFLAAYIETSSKLKKAFVPSDSAMWISTLEKDFPGRFESDNLEVYFQTLYDLQGEGQVPQSIYKPFNYDPQKPSVGTTLKEVVGIDYTKVLITGTVLVGTYAFLSGGYKALLRRK